MAAIPKQIISPQQVAGSATTYYTSTSIKTRIDSLSVCNTTSGAVTITIYIIPSAGAANDSTTVIKSLSLPGGYTWPGTGVVGVMMAEGNFFQASASAAASLTITAAGTQIS